MDGETKRETESEAPEAADAQTAEAETAETAAQEAGAGKPEEPDEVVSPVIDDAEIPTVPGDTELVARLEAEVADLKDQLLRQVAETQNVRRRLQRDKEDQVRYAAIPLIRDVLGAVDNLERALDSLPDGAGDEEGPLAQLIAGLELTRRELATAFERHNVLPIEAKGARMDPNLHEAMFEIQDPSVPSGTVIQVLQSGFTLHDRLVRPARVGVAKGGPAAAPEASEPESAEAGDAPDETPAAANDDAPEPGSHLDTEA